MIGDLRDGNLVDQALTDRNRLVNSRESTMTITPMEESR